MGPYGNLHIALEQMRVKALRDLHGSPRPEDEPERPNPPPRIMIIGPDNYGKTTVTKMLANYAVGAGQGWTPVLVNLDPGDVGIFSLLFFLRLFVPPSYSALSGWVDCRWYSLSCTT